MTFSVRASGPPPLRYQWRRNGEYSWSDRAGLYARVGRRCRQRGKLRANVSNDFDTAGVLSNQAMLTVAGGGAGATLLTSQVPEVQNVRDGWTTSWACGCGAMWMARSRRCDSGRGRVRRRRTWATSGGRATAGDRDVHERDGVWVAAAGARGVADDHGEHRLHRERDDRAGPVFVSAWTMFATPLINGHLGSAAGGRVGPVGAMPASASNSNYFRDVVFVPGGWRTTRRRRRANLLPANGTVVSGTVANTVTRATTGRGGCAVQGGWYNRERRGSDGALSADWDSGTLANGAHVLTVVARDAAGHTTSASVTVTVSNTGLAPETLLTSRCRTCRTW